MVIAALVVFGALLAAWLVVPAERAGIARAAEQRPVDVTPPMASPWRRPPSRQHRGGPEPPTVRAYRPAYARVGE